MEFHKINNKDPDYDLELFWFTYKCSFINFYKKYPNFNKDTNEWCSKLNLLKKSQHYNIIQKTIFDYLLLQSCDVIKSMDIYHLQILKTNINRYIKLCKKVYFYKFNNELDNLDNIVKIYHNILNNEYKVNDNIFIDIEVILFDNNYDVLLKYAIKNKKGFIFDRLHKIKNIKNDIKNLFNIDISNNMSGKKILNLYYN